MTAAIALITGEILAVQVIKAHCRRDQFRRHLHLKRREKGESEVRSDAG